MRFIVRKDFHLHHSYRVKGPDGKPGDTANRLYLPEDEVEFNEADARLHAHKLQGADDQAVKFLESLIPPPAVVADFTLEQLTAALAARGLVAVQAAKKAA